MARRPSRIEQAITHLNHVEEEQKREVNALTHRIDKLSEMYYAQCEQFTLNSYEREALLSYLTDIRADVERGTEHSNPQLAALANLVRRLMKKDHKDGQETD